ncbi:transglutaminase-like domain-containing protein [Infirmifilum uzonense]|uniref:transglutaminase-like domain-containing protein n=1 Tax=Infirmifilum uzonense TaxID=1550241 RepID=UPI000A77D250|nr:transglutaminase domain-containing protein [Infirmifilum uzonense]
MHDSSSKENILDFLKMPLQTDLKTLIESGEHEKAILVIKELLSRTRGEQQLRLKFELLRLELLEKEFPYSLEEAFHLASGELVSLSIQEFQDLIGRGCVDHIISNGHVRVHKRFVPNMFWLCPELGSRRRRGESELGAIEREALRWRAERVKKFSEDTDERYVLPLKYKIRFSLKIHDRRRYPGILRVWIPIPREEGINREVRILHSDPAFKHVAPPMHPQRTIYFELEETLDSLEVVYEFTSYGFYVKLNPNEASITQNSEILSRYTVEKPPHIVFSDHLIKLTKRIIEDEPNPLRKAQRIWDWITSNVRYTYAWDYSLYDSISEYVARNLRGDCGMQAILFITMARIAGIPARWQSGWYLNPVRPGMHDWAQIHIEPYGWIYVDPSFGNKNKGDGWRNSFYFGSIEGYRLAANIDISTQFDPPKEYFRSDPVDNQRGEVESKERNMYYDEWESSLEILEVERLEK